MLDSQLEFETSLGIRGNKARSVQSSVELEKQYQHISSLFSYIPFAEEHPIGLTYRHSAEFPFPTSEPRSNLFIQAFIIVENLRESTGKDRVYDITFRAPTRNLKTL
jgi:hypothetical protein